MSLFQEIRDASRAIAERANFRPHRSFGVEDVRARDPCRGNGRAEAWTHRDTSLIHGAGYSRFLSSRSILSISAPDGFRI